MAEVTNLNSVLNTVIAYGKDTTEIENLIDRFTIIGTMNRGNAMYLNPKEKSIILKALIDLYNKER